MWAIGRHYHGLEQELATPWAPGVLPRRQPRVIVPVSRMDRPTLEALAYARSLSSDVTAVHVTDDREELTRMQERWEAWGGPVQLVILESPYRALVAPLLAYLDASDARDPAQRTTIVLAEFVPRRFWEYPLHNQTALRLKLRLFFRPDTVVIDVPYHVGLGRARETG
jgi:hypothetical protein